MPRVAIIVTGLGLSPVATEAAIRRLPADVTLAFSPYAEALGRWVREARQAGHEVLLALPMESTAFPVSDAGPYALRVSDKPEETLRRLEFLLSRGTQYVGVATEPGTGFAEDDTLIRPVLQALKDRGLMFVDGVPGGDTAAIDIAREIELPRTVIDIVLDSEPSRAAIDAQFLLLENIIRKRQAAVARASPYPATLERLVAWIETLKDKNMVLAPVTAIVNRQP